MLRFIVLAVCVFFCLVTMAYAQGGFTGLEYASVGNPEVRHSESRASETMKPFSYLMFVFASMVAIFMTL
ncbi:hypothetical protein BaRGS_00025107 [Batillaria attramentaria]|uniref:Protein-export membrane protein SecG n=1 Tax=Batillaria attramentaria TaxID=370345 RepID=A0ABD0K994_9CAEN